MQIRNNNNQNFGQLYLTKAAVYSSPKTYFALQQETGKLMKLADDVDIFLKKKLLKDRFSGADIDLIIKVREKRPDSSKIGEKILNFIKKPILKSESAYGGMNFGMFDSPLKVAAELKENLMKRINKVK